LGQRSRKRGRRAKPAARAPERTATRAPRGRAAESADAGARGAGADSAGSDARGAVTTATRRRSSEERNQAIRATLTPVEAGERPWPLAVSALIALALVVANLVLLIAHVKFKLGSEHASVASQILYLVVMSMCAYGLWRAKYWAVLGFMVILLLVILAFTLLLIRADNVLAVVVGVVIIGPGSFLFYKLIRVLSRIQMPRPPSR
jgi:divalent metal cation (Fe/Co/Zn/Cd) transporter